ncbi:uncharacterized protein [Lolium perenne]|uniref:uncharacterized protein n=1 Tax=Lolium perenne TaxID=4522 RepID=UPI003A9A5CED
MAAFNDFHRHRIDLKRINYGIITLIPKGPEADKIQKFRPICLLQVLFKIFTKALTNRAVPVMNKIIHLSQIAFIKGRYITDGVALLQEVLRESKFRKQQGVVLKIDFEKAYDKVNWNFLFDCCKQKGSSDSWMIWIRKVVADGTLSVKVNDRKGAYFGSHKGVRQGDPFAPFLFNMAANSLAKMISIAQQNGLLTGLADNIVQNGVAMLQYADDTILLIQDDVEQARNLKLLSYLFEAMSGLKINFDKSENVTVAESAALGWNLSFRRFVTPDLAHQVHGLLHIVRQTTLSHEKDKSCWKWTKSGKFTVKSMYNHLCRNSMDRSFKHLWKSRIPLKIKIWLWLIWHNAIATKDNLLKRNWVGSASCQFCQENETISHLFFECVAAKFVWSSVATALGAPDRPGSFTQFFWWLPRIIPASRNVQIAGLAAICWAIWKLRNRSCFDHKLINNPNELISFATVLMNYWAGLHNSSDAENIRAGAASLLQLATSVPATSMDGRPGRMLRIADAMMEDLVEDQMEMDE